MYRLGVAAAAALMHRCPALVTVPLTVPATTTVVKLATFASKAAVRIYGFAGGVESESSASDSLQNSSTFGTLWKAILLVCLGAASP